eukprot:TRINITY_DN30617_c0_g2_i1.p2 TRINITY_DN30617_c0_g2~~TRINITY_DN30617_c0_g2_i1.p2  ORF type:complete len:105 (-),score=2.30 TRINITY_DN30617_c0_g2_i1:384-698(-)
MFGKRNFSLLNFSILTPHTRGQVASVIYFPIDFQKKKYNKLIFQILKNNIHQFFLALSPIKVTNLEKKENKKPYLEIKLTKSAKDQEQIKSNKKVNNTYFQHFP